MDFTWPELGREEDGMGVQREHGQEGGGLAAGVLHPVLSPLCLFLPQASRRWSGGPTCTR